MRKTLMAAAIVSALGMGTAAQAGLVAVSVNDNGIATGNASSVIWSTGNILFENVAPGGGVFTLHGHNSLSSFVGGTQLGGAAPGTEITMIYSTPAFADTIPLAGGGAFNFLGAGPGTMAWFYDTAPNANSITGLGYGDGKPILVATINLVASPGAGTLTVAPSPPPGGLLDQFTADGSGDDSSPSTCAAVPCVGGAGVITNIVSGSLSLTVDVTYFDPLFFPLGGITTTGVVDLTYGSTTLAPFTATNPSDIVGFGLPNGPFGGLPGAIPNYGGVGPGPTEVNDFLCPAGGSCDVHTSGTGDQAFQGTSIPAPGSLALLGLGLGALGMIGKRRRSKAS